MSSNRKLMRYVHIASSGHTTHNNRLQEVQTAANKAVKELAEHEKRVIGLQEKMKHASTRAKKLKKSVQEVRQ